MAYYYHRYYSFVLAYVYCTVMFFSPSFNFDFLSISQEIGWNQAQPRLGAVPTGGPRGDSHCLNQVNLPSLLPEPLFSRDSITGSCARPYAKHLQYNQFSVEWDVKP